MIGLSWLADTLQTTLENTGHLKEAPQTGLEQGLPVLFDHAFSLFRVRRPSVFRKTGRLAIAAH